MTIDEEIAQLKQRKHGRRIAAGLGWKQKQMQLSQPPITTRLDELHAISCGVW